MFFDSATFLVLLLFVVPLSWGLLKWPGFRQATLLGISYVFYGWWDWRFLGLIVLSTLIDYAAALLISRARAQGRPPKVHLLVSVVSQLGILAYFKYANFFIDSLEALGAPVASLHLDIVLPVGISFYTFQTLAYTIDVYRGTLKAERNLLTFALYVAWFPQLVAGPIERASRLLPQLKARPRFDAQLISDGLLLIFWGLFKKMVIADHAAQIANSVFSSPTSGALDWWVGSFAFALQIYGDFSGYSDVARGTSRLFGVELMVNFRHPYLAIGPQDFWRRWHISLSEWLRDYLYLSLGGNRKGPGRTYANLLITMLLGGLWHGAAWHFVLWGAYHGVLLGIERRLGWARAPKTTWGRGLRIVAMFQFTLFGWLLFRIESVADLGRVFTSVFRAPWGSSQVGGQVSLILVLCLPIVLIHTLQLRRRSMEVLPSSRGLTRLVFTLSVSILMLLFRVQDRIEFIYFRF